MVRTDQLNDGQYFDTTHVGYGGTISGDVHPFSGTPGPLGKDDLGFGTSAGVELGGQLANGVGVNTNYGAPDQCAGSRACQPTGADCGHGSLALTTAAWNSRGAAGVVNGINVKQAYDAAGQDKLAQQL